MWYDVHRCAANMPPVFCDRVAVNFFGMECSCNHHPVFITDDVERVAVMEISLKTPPNDVGRCILPFSNTGPSTISSWLNVREIVDADLVSPHVTKSFMEV